MLLFKKIFKLQDAPIERKTRSINYMKSLGIRADADLPLVNFDHLINLRSRKVISNRVFTLYYFYLFANKEILSHEIIHIFERHSVFFQLTEKERDLIWNGTRVEKVNYIWSVERLWALLWVLGKVDSIENPNLLCNPTQLDSIFRNPTGILKPENLREQTRMRTLDEILDLTDLYLRLNWYCIDSQLKNNGCRIIDSRVVYERLYALQWVLYYPNIDWDACI
jgi:hypothetical protein